MALSHLSCCAEICSMYADLKKKKERERKKQSIINALDWYRVPKL